MEDVLVVRRPLYDEKLRTVGHELLFQDSDLAQVDKYAVPANLTWDDVIACLAQEEIQQTLLEGPLFLSCSESMLTSPLPEEGLPLERLVLTIDTQALQLGETHVQAVQVFKEQVKIALAGCEQEELPQEFFDVADFAKLDVSSLDSDALKRQVRRLSRSSLTLIAEGITTHEMFDRCQGLSFEFFQGYFLSLPNLVTDQKVSSNRIATLRLLSALEDREISVDKVEALLSQDPRLSYRLLRVVNSSAYGLSRKVESLRQAVVFLGLEQVRSFANLIVLTSCDDKPSDLMMVSMVRARMCELVATAIDAEDPKGFFTAGLFSMLEPLLDMKMETVLNELKLSDILTTALLEGEGEVGRILNLVIAYTEANWAALKDSGIEMSVWRDTYLQSTQWATESLSEFK